MLLRVGRPLRRAVSLALVRGISREAEQQRQVARLVHQPKDRAPDPGAYVAWQTRVIPALTELDHMGLNDVLMEAEKRLPLLPGDTFTDAWMRACVPVMGRIALPCLVLAHRLGGKADPVFLRQLGMRGKAMSGDVGPLTALLRLHALWGGTAETMRPSFEEWEKAALQRIRATSAVQVGGLELLHDSDYVPSAEFVETWVNAAVARLQFALPRRDMGVVIKVLLAAFSIPVDKVELLSPLVSVWTQHKPDFEGVSDKKVVYILHRLADYGFELPQVWIGGLVAELVRRLPLADQSHIVSFLVAFSHLALPHCTDDCVTAFVAAWTKWFLPVPGVWESNLLVRSVAALVRLRVDASTISIEWYYAWIRAAQISVAVSRGLRGNEGVPGLPMCAPADLLLACRAVASKLFSPTDAKLSESISPSRLVAAAVWEVFDAHTLACNDVRVLGELRDKLELPGFRHYQKVRAVEFLRELEERSDVQKEKQ